MSKPIFPNESPQYRTARESLLQEEKRLRASIEKVAELRRQLPLGGTPPQDYIFQQIQGDQVRDITLGELFQPGTESLLLYSFMYGPRMESPCPSCTSLLDSLNGAAPHISRSMSIAAVSRSPIERFERLAKQRGWQNLKLLSAASNDYPRDYKGENDEGQQVPMANVWVKRNGQVRHFWASELLWSSIDGGDPRHMDMLWPLWGALDLTPEGRGTFSPKVTY